MPETPEITSRAREMDSVLPGKVIHSIEVLQPKCLNIPPEKFINSLENAVIKQITSHGKWIMVDTSSGWLLLNLGMGGEILLTARDNMPSKFRLVFDFTDRTCLAINFWWFGYAFYAPSDGLQDIPAIAKLGPNVLDLSLDAFITLLGQRNGKTRVKAFLLDQSKVAGIGNAYIHDILFMAKLHPNRLVSSLTDDEQVKLYESIQGGLLPSLEKGGAFYETNLFGEKGGFTMDDILIGYREGSPCPRCGTSIEKIRTGSTSSFICPACQSTSS